MQLEWYLLVLKDTDLLQYIKSRTIKFAINYVLQSFFIVPTI